MSCKDITSNYRQNMAFQLENEVLVCQALLEVSMNKIILCIVYVVDDWTAE